MKISVAWDRPVAGMHGSHGLVRADTLLAGGTYAPHRHDAYSIGVVVSGELQFRCRGRSWRCAPGQVFIVQPDEVHDGMPATDDGVALKTLHLDPSLVQAELGGRPLPRIASPVPDIRRCRLWQLWPVAADGAAPDRGAVIRAAVDLLLRASDARRPARALAIERLIRVRDHLIAMPGRGGEMKDLERLAGMDRWSLTRQFRAAFGTTPTRYRVLRQLDRVRGLLASGSSLAEAAIDAGFADQSHMGRHFKRAYGMTPGVWVEAFIRQAPLSWLRLP